MLHLSLYVQVGLCALYIFDNCGGHRPVQQVYYQLPEAASKGCLLSLQYTESAAWRVQIQLYLHSYRWYFGCDSAIT